MSARTRAFLFAWACCLAAPAMGFVEDEALPVDPAELARRDDLIGKVVVIDDHVAYYVPRNGLEPDELQLKRTPITFLIPRKLRPRSSTRMSSVIVRGVFQRNEGRLVCEVTDLASVASDLDRLEQGLSSLGAKDSETRKAWARWAERRAKDFKDEPLRKRARALEAEALRIEADMKRLGVDAPQEWLALAQDARRRQVSEPEPSAQGHRALRAKLAVATDAALLKGVIQEIEAFFPKAAADVASGHVNLAPWEGPYAEDPAGAYRTASLPVRKGLDRRLWADATERFLELQVSRDIQSALALAQRAETTLPEKKGLAGRLIEKAIRQARQDLGALRQSEVKDLAGVLRDKLGQPAEALGVLRDWLKVQQGRLSATDAEGPLLLANLYEELLQDRVTALELLRKAWRIDPTSKEIAEAFRTRGFRKIQNEWVEAARGADPDTGKEAGPALVKSQGLIGLTPEELRLRLGGKPDRVNYIGSRGQLIEQWIYLDTQRVRYVNLLHTPGDLKPRVVAHYTLPRTSVKGGLGPSR
jgi:hypothetical protein